jgi:hypothetical protein
LTYLTEDSQHPDFSKAYPKEKMQYALLKAVDFVLGQQQAMKINAFSEAELEDIYKTQGDFDWANNLNVCVCTCNFLPLVLGLISYEAGCSGW